MTDMGLLYIGGGGGKLPIATPYYIAGTFTCL